MRSSSYKPSDSADALRDSDVFFLAATSHRETFFILLASQTQMLLPVTANSEPRPRTARRDPSAGSWQRWENRGDESEYHVDWVVGSGNHASGYLVDIGGHLFQSPVAYYKSRQSYDLAPGYENQSDPDFTRPVRRRVCPLPFRNRAARLRNAERIPLARISRDCRSDHLQTLIQLDEVRQNVPIDAAQFAKPTTLLRAANQSAPSASHP